MSAPRAIDVSPETDEFRRDVLTGLDARPKTLPCKYLYDEKGSQLFEAICETADYYPTRTELGILERSAEDIAEHLGPRCLIVEYGSGAGIKTELLLSTLDKPAIYVPIEISIEILEDSARRIKARHPELEVVPLCADYTGDFELPEVLSDFSHRVVFFPGSTIGNFDRGAAREFLHHAAEVAGEGGGLLIGVDLVKDREILERAYNDSEGVTAEFNLNLLERINNELGADFDLDRFQHRAAWNADDARIEMYLVSLEQQSVHLVDGAGESREIVFGAGECIVTEHSNKYTLSDFAALAAEAGFEREEVWTDADELFSVQYLVVR